MKIITLLNSKGGVGKTTLCFNIAAGVLVHHNPVIGPILLIDADPQASLRDWHNLDNSTLQLIVADRKQSLISSARLARESGTEVCIIDTPGHISDITGAALSITDLAIIPLQPSALDVWSTIDTIDLVRRVMTYQPSLQSLFVINKSVPNSTLSADVIEAISASDDCEIPLWPGTIHGRVAFARTAAQGKTVFASDDRQAKQEILDLCTAILKKLYK